MRRTLLQTKEWAILLAHLSGARRNGPFNWPILSEIRGIGPFIWPISAGRIEMALLFGPFFGASPQPARRNPDTPLARQQGKATAAAAVVRLGALQGSPAGDKHNGTGGTGGAASVWIWSTPTGNTPIPTMDEAADGVLRWSASRGAIAQNSGRLSLASVRPRRLAASHVFASLERLGQGCAPTPRGGLRCTLAARCVHAWEGRA
jgi:hypothetical protein